MRSFFSVDYFEELVFGRPPNNLLIAIWLGQMPITLASVSPAAGKKSSQLTAEKPVRKIPVHSKAASKANHTRMVMGAFMVMII
jgi:hypothetical protein